MEFDICQILTTQVSNNNKEERMLLTYTPIIYHNGLKHVWKVLCFQLDTCVRTYSNY